jgi:predicted nuclease of predicted toxin-antitoxin system
MRFLIDRCAGRKLAEWLRSKGHDVLESRTLGPDPGDRELLKKAAEEARILITIDTNFGQLVYMDHVCHCGIVRLPDVPAERRIELMKAIFREHASALNNQAIITVRGQRIRISKPPRAR